MVQVGKTLFGSFVQVFESLLFGTASLRFLTMHCIKNNGNLFWQTKTRDKVDAFFFILILRLATNGGACQ